MSGMAEVRREDHVRRERGRRQRMHAAVEQMRLLLHAAPHQDRAQILELAVATLKAQMRPPLPATSRSHATAVPLPLALAGTAETCTPWPPPSQDSDDALWDSLVALLHPTSLYSAHLPIGVGLFLFSPLGSLLDCNSTMVQQFQADSKEQLLAIHPASLQANKPSRMPEVMEMVLGQTQTVVALKDMYTVKGQVLTSHCTLVAVKATDRKLVQPHDPVLILGICNVLETKPRQLYVPGPVRILSPAMPASSAGLASSAASSGTVWPTPFESQSVPSL